MSVASNASNDAEKPVLQDDAVHVNVVDANASVESAGNGHGGGGGGGGGVGAGAGSGVVAGSGAGLATPQSVSSMTSERGTFEVETYSSTEVVKVAHNVTRHRNHSVDDTIGPWRRAASAAQAAGGPEAGGDKAGAPPTETLDKVAVNVSFAVNVALVVFKVIAAIASGSAVVIASTLDSVLDILSGGIIFCTARAISKRDLANYPVGKTRLAPVGIIVFASVMGTSTATMIIESVQGLIDGKGAPLDINAFVVAILVATIILKFALYILCGCCGSRSSSVLALAEDHRNDTISNAVAVVTAVLAGEFFDTLWWLDGLGAVLVGLYIIIIWVLTGYEQVKKLAGHAAEPKFINEIADLATNYHDKLRLDKIRAYHFGDNYLVELEVLLPAEMTVRNSHEIGLALQQEIETHERVERSFVHIDYKERPHEEHFDPATGECGTFEA